MSTIKQEVADLPQPVSFLEAVIYWLKLGFISFGGPAGQISMMHQELVEKRRWISEHRFLHALNYTMVLPPLFILSGLTWIYLVYGDVPFPYIVLMAGASIATLFTFLPSFLFILLGGPAVEATRGGYQVHCAVNRHYRRCGGRDSQSGTLFCLPCVVA